MKKVFGILFVAIFVCSLVVVWPVGADAEELVSKPGEYSGYSEVLYDGWQRFSQYVAVSYYADAPDGTPLENPTKLAIDIFRPTLNGVVVETPHPVLFCFTPYRRATAAGMTGKSFADYFCKYGYVIAVGDTRGKGASYGYRKAANDRIEAQDGHDLIEWLAAQPWCDGNVGMWGGSYMGQTILEAISMVPPHLKAAFIGITDFNKYDGWSRNGICRPSAAPVGNWTDDLITLPVDGDVDGPDPDPYPDMLYEACSEHQYNGPFTGMLELIPYRDSYSDISESQYWEEISASNYLDGIAESGVPAYLYGGWYDFLRRDTVMMFANWPNPVKMFVGPQCHGGPWGINSNVEHHRWYDYWLKGIDNGVMNEPPIYYAVMDTPIAGWPQIGEFRYAWQWPLPNEAQLNYFLEGGVSGTSPSVNDGTLDLTAPTSMDAKDDYEVDHTITANVEPLFWGVHSGIPGTEWDIKGLTYTSEPLVEDLEVTGHAMVHLWVSSDNQDADFMVFLEDVAPDGRSTYICDGRLRASLRSSQTPPYDFLGLPWHRCYEEDEQKLTPGEPVELVIDMMPTSYVFKAGHRIRLAVTGACGNLFFLKPPHPDAPTFVSVYRNAVLTSYISLPITTEPIAPAVQIAPDTLYLSSPGVFTAYVTPEETLPSGYRAEDIDISTVECNGAPAVRGTVQDGTLMVHFNRQDLVDVPTGDEVTLTVTGEFYYGIPFAGSDTIRVI